MTGGRSLLDSICTCPFAKSKCIYCDFNSYAHMEDKFEPFVGAICADIERGISRFLPGEMDDQGAVISTVFFGGGTPAYCSLSR